MLYDDLRAYSGSNSLNDARIRGKYAAEMAYYAVLETMIRRYAPSDARDIRYYNNDLLASARDEMAKHASDKGIVKYVPGSGGLVDAFVDEDGNPSNQLSGSQLRNLVKSSFQHSEALQNMVYSYLCSSPAYRSREMTEDEIKAAVDQEFARILDESNPESALSAAIGIAERATGNGDGVSDRYAPNLPEHRIMPDGRRMTATGRTVRGLKISPLIPEMRVLRRSGYMNAELGLTARQDSLRGEDDLAKNNPILSYDPDKKLLYNPDRAGSIPDRMFNGGVVVGRSAYWAETYFDPMANLHSSMYGRRAVAPGKLDRDMSKLLAFRMAHILDTYSYQELTEGDYDAIWRIFDRGRNLGTIFGSFEDDFDAAIVNADAYMGYIDHVCGAAERHMQSHEFEIHIEPQKTFTTEEYGRGFVPLLYFTGERTSDYRRARSNGARFFSVYPYARYVPKTLDGLPVMGDAAPASYAGYVFTRQAHRGSASDANMNSKTANPYVSGMRVTAEMCRSMTEVFDAYIDPSRTRGADVSLTRIKRSVGATGIEDLSVFIDGSGGVDGDAILKVLVADMNVTKSAAKIAFQTKASADLLTRVFNRFKDAQSGGLDEDGERAPMDVAMWLYANNNRHGKDMSRFRENLAGEMDRHLMRELKAVSGEDLALFDSSQHIFRKYIGEFVESASAAIGGRGREEMLDMGSLDGAGLEDVAARLVGQVTDPDSRHVAAALREIYGDGSLTPSGDVDLSKPQTVILKANMLRNASSQLRTGDYDDLLSLLSYTDRVVYEPDSGRRSAEVHAGLDTAGTYAAIQLFSSSQSGVLENSLSEDMDDDRLIPEDDENSAAAQDPLSDQKAWFDATFSVIGGPGDRTLAWVDRDDFNAEPDLTTGRFDDEAVEHALFVASHPLQIEAMRRVSRHVSRYDGYDPANLGVTKDGVIYYIDGDGRVALKVGPVLDEAAYVMPCIEDAIEGDPNAVEIDRPVLNGDGWPVRDAQGLALTEKASVSRYDGALLDENGRLMNQVLFGALSNGDGAAGNRIYGVSMKMRNTDGYYHEGFQERMSMSTYHMNVLENLDRSLALYEASMSSDPARMAAARSTMYTAVSGNSLRKAYRTNTMIMLDKAMCRAADAYLSGETGVFGPDDIEPAHRVANLFAAQCDDLRSRCVLAKLTEDQNVGLFNQSRHLQQARADRVTGEMDRKNLLRTDCVGGRAMVFQSNPYLDALSTGTAKNVGSVAYMSDAVRVDRLTGDIELDPDATDAARAKFLSLGITDVDTGGLDMRLMRHPDGQAVDRSQLARNGASKGVYYSKNMKFAMINLGFNMEDGYMAAERSGSELGHFNEELKFVRVVAGDKMGECEAGNKGVVSLVVPTSIDTEEGYLSWFTYRYLQTHAFNHGANGNSAAAGHVDKAVGNWLRSVSADPDVTLESYMRGLPADSGRTVGDLIDDLRTLQLDGTRAGDSAKYKGDRGRDMIEETRKAIETAMAGACADVGSWLLAEGAEPFAGSYGIRHRCWQLFQDNPDLDITMTNVCVCTRSNPSILMSVNDALQEDLAYLEAHRSDPGFDKDAWLRTEAKSVLIVRDENGDPQPVMGACGYTPVYVDCHYADDKNKDYNELVKKNGRGYGMQEFYALLAKHCTFSLVPYITANDPVLPKQLAKLNRRIMMNGFVFDMDDGMQCKHVASMFKDADLDMASEDGITKACSSKPGHMFIDMDVLAERLIRKLPENTPQQDVDAALAKIGEEQDFTKFMALIHGVKSGDVPSAKTDEGLRNMFISLMGQYGGAFLLESEPGGSSHPVVDVGLTEWDREASQEVPSPLLLSCNIGDRSAIPVFLSNREIKNSEGDVMNSPSEDRLQFKIFKSALGTALAGKLGEMDHADGRPYATAEACDGTARKCCEFTRRQYNNVRDEQSLSLDDMNFWLKKCLYRTTFPNSLTCVWHGDPTLEIDECGISFEKAKSLNILTPKKGLSPDELARIPDTYEFMHERYEPLTDNDTVLVNRSPGQTTGCIRLLRAKITGPEGGSIAIHPALATIFDGDFDGDTVGVINPRTPEGMDILDPEFEELCLKASTELSARMSMKANMVHKANFTELDMPDGSGTIQYLHPLFIAGNADLAVAKYNMSMDKDGEPACGYDVGKELDNVMAMANLLEQMRQCAYDKENADKKRISEGDAARISGIRMDLAKSLVGYFDAETGRGSGTARDNGNRAAWREILDDARPMYQSMLSASGTGAVPEPDLRLISKLEERTFHRLADTYREMTGYMAEPALMTHGRSAVDIMYNVISDANISKKGKEPQLNALLQFSGMHKDCAAQHGGNAEGLLTVGKGPDKKFHLMAQHPDESGELKAMILDRQADGSYRLIHDGRDYGTYDKHLDMDHRKSVSDILPTPFANPVMSNIIAQSDKSDATGIGGSMAQKMQKVLAPFGYGELALRISGPLTQQYLDSKQNVRNCDKNLKIGKTILNKVAAGACVNELQDRNFANGNAVHLQVYNGQYTLGDHKLDAAGYVSQMDNFLQVMHQPGLSPLDRAQFEAVMRNYEYIAVKGPDKGRKIVGNPIRTADQTHDMVYAAIYPSEETAAYAKHMERLVQAKKGLFSGSGIFDGRVDMDRLRDSALASSGLPEHAATLDRITNAMQPDAAPETGKEAAVERALGSAKDGLKPATERPAVTEPGVADATRERIAGILARYKDVVKDVAEPEPADTLAADDSKDVASDGRAATVPEDMGDVW